MNRALAYLALILTILFCWIIYPYKWIRKALFNQRKRNAINKCHKMSSEQGCKILVVQNGSEFICGSVKYFRGMNTKMKKRVKGSNVFFDYRSAIVYSYNIHDK